MDVLALTACPKRLTIAPFATPGVELPLGMAVLPVIGVSIKPGTPWLAPVKEAEAVTKLALADIVTMTLLAPVAGATK